MYDIGYFGEYDVSSEAVDTSQNIIFFIYTHSLAVFSCTILLPEC